MARRRRTAKAACSWPEYEPLEMTIQYKATGADLVTLKADSETGIYNLSVRQGSNTSLGLIRLDDDKNASYTVIRMDNNDQIDVDTYDEFDIPDFEGVLMLSVTGQCDRWNHRHHRHHHPLRARIP